VARADFKFDTGVGIATGHDPDATDPDVGISWSNDGGLSWSNEFARKLGRQYTQSRVTMLRSGMTGSEGRRWRLKVSAAVYAAFRGGSQDTQLRNH